jgi:hypothetical protein
MGWKRTSRQEDEAVLWMIRRRAAGISSARIGAALGITSASVRIQTTRVRDADTAESGEPPHEVSAAYWSQV